MTYNLNLILNNSDNFAIQNDSLLVKGFYYYFKMSNDDRLFRGKLKNIFTTFERRLVFTDVSFLEGDEFKKFCNEISSSIIYKIYYLE
jgi:hypothetical protein